MKWRAWRPTASVLALFVAGWAAAAPVVAQQTAPLPPANEVTQTGYPAQPATTRLPAVRLAAIETRLEELEKEKGKSLEDRLKKIESDLKKAADKDAKKKADDASKPTFKMGGRIHMDYWAFPDESPGANAFETGNPANEIDDRFLFRRARIEMRGTVPDNMEYKLDIDFNVPNNPQFKDAYFGWNELPVFRTLLLGNQKRPYGLDHINSSKNNVFMERPYIIEAFNQDARRFGLESYGVSEDLRYNWRYGVFMGQDLQGTGIATATPIGENYQGEFAGRFANTAWYDEASDGRGYAHWAVSGAIANPAGNDPAVTTANFQTRPEARTVNRWLATGPIAGADTYELFGLEGLLNFGSLQICSEYQRTWLQRDNGGADLAFDGYYVYVSYFLTGEHMTWERDRGSLGRVKPLQNFFIVRNCDECIESGWGAWQVACRFSHADLTDDNVAGGVGNSVTLGLNWWWNAYSRMQFNYIYGNIQDHAPVAGFTSGDYHIIGTRYMVEW